jgi:uncharacterized membrane protein YqjE
MSKITKTTIILIVASLTSLIIPIIGKWYELKTNIVPIVFYIICIIGGYAMVILNLYLIWNNDKK